MSVEPLGNCLCLPWAWCYLPRHTEDFFASVLSALQATEGARMSMLGITLTGSQERAIRRLIGFLDETAACYQFSGGFAGNLHGSHWPLHDLDVEVAQQDLTRLAALMQPY